MDLTTAAQLEGSKARPCDSHPSFMSMRSRRLTFDHCNRMLVVTSVRSSGTVGTTQALYSLLGFAGEETKSLPRAEFICEEQRELFFMQRRLDLSFHFMTI
jgi:hypothetical protein